MENNIFENSHFGKLYKTKGKKKAVFLNKWELSSDLLSDDEKLVYKLWIEGEDEPYLYNSKGKLWGETYAQFEDGTVEEYDTDIVSEWNEEIDKEELKKQLDIKRKENQFIPCYKCEYRKECDYYISGESIICKVNGCKTPDESAQIEFRKNFE